MSSVFSRKITMSTFSGCFTGDGTPCEPAHRPQAHVQVEDLAQRDVEAADAAADRRGERALDADEVLAERRRRSPRAASRRSRRTPSARRAPLSRRSSCRASPRRRRSTSCDAGQMSTPVPSPSMNGMIGSSGTREDAVDEGDLLGHGGLLTVGSPADRTSAGERRRRASVEQVDGQRTPRPSTTAPAG